ncbi:hypothetical protein [Nocardia sp. NPDC057030]|uniref:hypothetical protein n=1 Tax=Nocardia sp. NPDC057030 TaxID=3346005 RepID=UPI00363786A6
MLADRAFRPWVLSGSRAWGFAAGIRVGAAWLVIGGVPTVAYSVGKPECWQIVRSGLGF